jgi:hypothetical protein
MATAKQIANWIVHYTLDDLGAPVDPLLITQHVADCIYGIGISTHADHFDGDKMKWLKDHAHMIDWTGCEQLRAEVLAYKPEDGL